MLKAQRAIEPVDFSSIPRIKDLIDDLPNDVRVCQQHDEPVVIRESEFLPNQGPAAPFAKAAFVGCCDGAIANVLSAIGVQSLVG